MSIIIHGMKLPKEGRITIEIGSDGAVYSVEKKEIWAEKYESDFPACEIPPHGRLIDGDALEEYCKKQAEDEWSQKAGTLWSYAFEEFKDIVYNRETIIEASE